MRIPVVYIFCFSFKALLLPACFTPNASPSQTLELNTITKNQRPKLVVATFGRSSMTYDIRSILDLVSNKEVKEEPIGFEIHPNIASENIGLYINRNYFNNTNSPIYVYTYTSCGARVKT